MFQTAEQWLEDNHTHEKFMLVIDSFDVHEPFHNPDSIAGMYTDEDIHDPDLPIWAHSGRTDEGNGKLSERQLAFIRSQYAAKITLVDKWLGKVFNKLDEHQLWDDTMVIVTSDHGHYLGERNLMGKPSYNNYNVLANIPLIVWHPQGAHNGSRVSSLTSTVDLYATMMVTLGGEVRHSEHSHDLLPILTGQASIIRDWAIYGYFGRALNITDGRHTYHVPPDENIPLYNYSTMYINPVAFFFPDMSRTRLRPVNFYRIRMRRFGNMKLKCHRNSLSSPKENMPMSSMIWNTILGKRTIFWTAHRSCTPG